MITEHLTQTTHLLQKGYLVQAHADNTRVIVRADDGDFYATVLTPTGKLRANGLIEIHLNPDSTSRVVPL